MVAANDLKGIMAKTLCEKYPMAKERVRKTA